MKILFISRDLIGANLAVLLEREGCDVKLFIEKSERKSNFDGLIQKTESWEKELNWVGKDGLIIFDDIGYGEIQDKLRVEGYSVFGGSKLGDTLEEDREWAQRIFKKVGLKTLITRNFPNIDSTIKFLKKNKGPWVIKQNGHLPKDLNHVGHFKNNSDVISVLENYTKNHGNSLGVITLQKRVYGVEVGIGRYFNGDDWVGPIEINIEHKKLFPGDLGPSTTEMGTLAWYDDDEENSLFKETLAKLKPFLKEIDFRGDIDLGCIANQEGVYCLEATPRLGTPIVHLHSEIHISPWHKLLKAIADKKPFKLKWSKGYGIVVLVSLPPFPYKQKMNDCSPLGLEIYFDNSVIKNNFRHVHFEGVLMKNTNKRTKKYYISDDLGYILYVTALGESIKDAWKKAEKILDKIYVPKMFYRNDIGLNFEEEGREKLRIWGYLK